MNLLDPISWSVVLLVLGCGLLVLEVFIPSGGLLSFFAAVALVTSIVVAFRRDLSTGLTVTAITVFAVPIAVGLAFKYWPLTSMGKSFLGELPSEEETAPSDPRRDLVGRRGVAQSKMLPSGSVMVEGRLIDAVSRGVAIEKGEPIEIIEVQGNRVVVRLVQSQEATDESQANNDILNKPIEDFGLESIDEPLA
jgi:membrane-bound serine protease (ClpP class)